MPELPEVETMKRIISPAMGSKITNIYTSGKRLRKPIDKNVNTSLINAEIINIQRKAKYLIIDFNNQKSLVCHAGMSGNFFLEFNNKELLKHDHFILELNSNKRIRYNDPRRFGLIDIMPTEHIFNSTYFINIGPDAIDDEFNFNYLKQKLLNIKKDIKKSLLDQSIVAGIGNIYACESLYLSNISPLRKSNSLTDKEIKKLINEIKNVLHKSIELGGSSLKDYKPNGKSGYFQNEFKVYNQEGKTCGKQNCKNCIVKITQSGRSTFYCKTTQI